MESYESNMDLLHDRVGRARRPPTRTCPLDLLSGTPIQGLLDRGRPQPSSEEEARRTARGRGGVERVTALRILVRNHGRADGRGAVQGT